MIEIKGKYNEAKIFTDVVDSASIAQVQELSLIHIFLLAKAALGMAETARVDGFHIHLDDLYDINADVYKRQLPLVRTIQVSEKFSPCRTENGNGLAISTPVWVR